MPAGLTGPSNPGRPVPEHRWHPVRVTIVKYAGQVGHDCQSRTHPLPPSILPGISPMRPPIGFTSQLCSTCQASNGVQRKRRVRWPNRAVAHTAHHLGLRLAGFLDA